MTAKPRILIVDDEPSNVDLLLSILGEECQVIVATTGEQGLARAEGATPPDLILLDVQLPGMSGYDVCRRLKASKTTCDIPIVFVTGLDDVFDETMGLSLGAVDYITKPISPPIVRARVETHLRLRSTQQALELEQR